MFQLRINKPGHPFNGMPVIVTTSSSDGNLDSAYYHRKHDVQAMNHPVAVLILAKASAVQLMDIFEADELEIFQEEEWASTEFARLAEGQLFRFRNVWGNGHLQAFLVKFEGGTVTYRLRETGSTEMCHAVEFGQVGGIQIKI